MHPSIFAPRCNPAVSPINGTEIAILGGGDGVKHFIDVMLFNTETLQIVRAANGGDYSTFGN
jgi:hypothetical protein